MLSGERAGIAPAVLSDSQRNSAPSAASMTAISAMVPIAIRQ
jgi:hypothetical protein